MTKREAAIVSAYTGILIGDFSEMREYVEEILGRPVFTHELASAEMCTLIKSKSKNDFCAIQVR